MKILERKFDDEKIKYNYKKVVNSYNFWSLITKSKAAKKVIDFAEIKNGLDTLDVTCGIGVVFEKIVKLNPWDKNIEIDLSADMLKKAQKRIKKVSNKTYELKEGIELAFNGNSLDILIIIL
ncbi:MAG: class I SAM-dependent methyltransferase [Bacteroidales bacterium]|nr:class I SAM-dependent methyltransferase [Bacteroidales bacterium]